MSRILGLCPHSHKSLFLFIVFKVMSHYTWTILSTSYDTLVCHPIHWVCPVPSTGFFHTKFGFLCPYSIHLTFLMGSVSFLVRLCLTPSSLLLLSVTLLLPLPSSSSIFLLLSFSLLSGPRKIFLFFQITFHPIPSVCIYSDLFIPLPYTRLVCHERIPIF